jgi:hemerythrin-like metal-binding protein
MYWKLAMPIIHWTPDLSVGVGSIDTDHKLLISLINQLDDAIRGGEPQAIVTRVLDALLDYADYHFAREESLMRASGYSDLAAHSRAHATFRAQVHDFRDRYRRNAECVRAREVLVFLQNWLRAHIVGRDKLYAPFVQGAGARERHSSFGIDKDSAATVAVGH